jgi:hypothetical protein
MSEPVAGPPTPPGRGTRARHRSRFRGYVAGLVALLVTAGVVAVLATRSPGVRDPAGTPAAPASASGTPLDGVDVSDLPVARSPFCDAVDQDDVAAALGTPVAGTAHYTVGERVPLAPGVRDVSHEHDCTFRGVGGAEARALVFAEPVTVAVARGLLRAARGEPGCRVVDRGPTFGSPSVTTRCRTGPAGARAVTLRGLFGDAWLTCRLTLPGSQPDAVVRAERWCVQVVTGAAARP